jgi:uncharacterized membrane protein
MEAHLTMWLELLLRWAHFIVGVAWIGASFYFNWLENHLQRQNQPENTAGDLWAIHGGGFYYLKKFQVAPDELPPTLHWFKWEAYTTWLSGMALLIVVFYFNANSYMLNPEASDITASAAITIGLGALLLSWFAYDGLCRSILARHEAWLGVMVVVWFSLLAWALNHWLSGRATYIHIGAAIGTVMVANVFRVIIPAQKELVNAVLEDRRPDPRKGKKALQRSRHNNYFTLPVLFMMISSHFPATYSHSQPWLVLMVFSLAAVALRHYFNIRHLPGFSAWPLIPAALLLGVVIWITAPDARPTNKPATTTEDNMSVISPAEPVTTAQAFTLVQQRCVLCHAASPEFAGFVVAPLGVELDSQAKLLIHAERVYQTAAVMRSMPLGNLTKMTGAERKQIANWYENLEKNP